jgi:hypothetical protein
MELNRIHGLHERCRFGKRYWIAWQAFFEDARVYISDPARILKVQGALTKPQCCRTFVPKHYAPATVEPERDTVRAVHSQVIHTAPNDSRSVVSDNTSDVAAEDYSALYRGPRLAEIEHRYSHRPASALLKCHSEMPDKLKEIWNAGQQALQSRQGGALLMPNELVPGLS